MKYNGTWLGLYRAIVPPVRLNRMNVTHCVQTISIARVFACGKDVTVKYLLPITSLQTVSDINYNRSENLITRNHCFSSQNSTITIRLINETQFNKPSTNQTKKKIPTKNCTQPFPNFWFVRNKKYILCHDNLTLETDGELFIDNDTRKEGGKRINRNKYSAYRRCVNYFNSIAIVWKFIFIQIGVLS